MVSKPRTFKRFMPMLGLALVVSLALSAVGVASASAATQHWYVGGAKLAENTPTEYTTGVTSKLVLKWTQNLVKFEVVCKAVKTKQTGTGFTALVNNPTGGGAGTIDPFAFADCETINPKTCTARVVSRPQFGAATEFGGQPAVIFSAGTGILFEFEFYGPSCGLPGHTFTFYGSFTGTQQIVKSETRLQFTAASSSIAMGGVKPTTLEGAISLGTPTGKSLSLAP